MDQFRVLGPSWGVHGLPLEKKNEDQRVPGDCCGVFRVTTIKRFNVTGNDLPRSKKLM